MYSIKKALRKDFEVIYFDYDTGLKESIKSYSRELKEFINRLKLKRGEKVSLVGFSAGGIIAEYYARFLDKNRVDKIVTICSPFGGTWYNRVHSSKRKGLKELGYDSKLLKEIKKKKIRKDIDELNIWSYLDPLVPAKSGRGSGISLHTYFFIHWIITFYPPIIYKTRKFLLE